MSAELIAFDSGPVLENCKPSKPFCTNVLVPLLECQPALVVAVVEVGKMEEETQIDRLPHRAKLLHERVIETGEVLVAQ